MAIKNYSDFSGRYKYMSNAYNKNYSKQYDKYTADLQYDVPRLSKKANEALADSYIKAKSTNNRSSLDIKAKRSNWDRAGDALSAGQYAVMGGLKGALSDEMTVGEGITTGLKAANPFGDGYEKGEHEFKQVLEELGWKPETTVGKAARWTVGLLGDIFLDPTTYLTLGTSALAKGTGKVAIKSKKAAKIAEFAGKYGLDGIDDVAKIADEAYAQTVKRFAGSADVSSELVERLAKKNKGDVIKSINMLDEGMTMDDAIDIVRKKNVLTAEDALKIANKDKTNQTIREFVTKGGTSTSDEVTKNAEQLMNQFNKSIGISGAKEGITISLANAPFGKKLFGEAADGMFTVVSGDTLQKIGDKTVALGYQQLRDKVLGGQFGKLFSSKSLLYQAAKTNPGAVYDMLKYAEHIRGLKGDIIESEHMIRNMGKELHDLDPATANEVMELMQDKSKWVQVQKAIKLVDTQEGKAIRKRVEQDVAILKNNLEKFKNKQIEYETLLKDTKEIIRDMEEASAGISADKAKAMQDLYSESMRQREEIVVKLNAERVDELNKIVKEPIQDEKIVEEISEEFDKVSISKGEFEEVFVPSEEDNIKKITKWLKDFDQAEIVEKSEKDLIDFKTAFINNRRIEYGDLKAVDKKQQNRIFEDMVQYGEVTYKTKKSAEAFKKKFPHWNYEERVLEDGKRTFTFKPPVDDIMIRDGKVQSTNEYFSKKRQQLDLFVSVHTPTENRVNLISDMSEILFDDKYMLDLNMPLRQVDQIRQMLLKGDSIQTVKTFIESNYDKFSGKTTAINKFAAKHLGYKSIDDVVEHISYLEQFGKTSADRAELLRYKNMKRQSNEIKERLKKIKSFDEMKQVMQELENKKRMENYIESDLPQQAIENRRQSMLEGQSENKKKKGYDGSDAFRDEKYVQEQLKIAERDNISKQHITMQLKKRMLGNLPDEVIGKKELEYLDAMTNEVFRLFKENVNDTYDWKKMSDDFKNKIINLAGHNLNVAEKRRVTKLDNAAKTVLDKRIKSQRLDAIREAIESAKEKPVDLGEMAIKSDIVDESVQRADNMIETINKKYDEMIAKATSEFDELRRREAFDIRIDFVKRGENIKKSKRQYEELYKQYKREYLTKFKQTQKFYDNFQGEIERLQNVVNDDMAFETYYRYKFSNVQADAILNVYNKDLGKVLLDPKLNVDEKTRTVAEKLRESFIEMGRGEVKYDKLDEKAFEAHLLDYFPHVITEEGAEYFAKNKTIDGLAGFGTDLGYGKKFNPYGMERTIKKILMPDDTWVINPTVAQINEAFKHKLKGANLFADNLADVYVARAMKNNELMYDNEYMRNMLDTFGKPFAKGDVLEPGKKLVMNHGMLRKNIEEMAEMEVSMEMGADIRNFIRSNNLYKKLMMEAETMYGKATTTQAKVARKKYINVEMQKYIDNYVKGKYTDEVKSKMYQSVIDENSHKHIKDITMPMVEMDTDEYSRIYGAFEDVNNRYIGSIKERFQRFESNYVNDYFDEKTIGTYDFQDVMKMDTKQLRGYIKNRILKVDEVDAARLEKMMKDLDKLDQIQPMKANQVVEAITQKANQARKLSVVKDNSDMLKLYDKFTHFIKLNQTTVLPSFHLRNAYSNTFQNWLAVGSDVMNKDLQTNAFKVMKNEGLNDALLEINHIDGSKTHISWTDLFDKARKYGAVGDGYYDLDIKTGSKTKGLFKKLDPKLDPTNTAEFLPYQMGAKIGTIVESKDRLLHFASMVSRGKSYEEAAESVNKFLFDYSDLTGFESSVMKRVLPYYTWLRKNAALQLDQ